MRMSSSEKILSKDELAHKLETWRAAQKKIVFTNGCFDILHLGHIDYLEKASELGDLLVVGLNTDASVKRLKGPERPINKEYARARVLAALGFVSAVVLFDEDTPLELIKLVSPNILVKGDDYEIRNIIGADYVLNSGGVVKTITLVNGYSTTKIIENLKK